MKRLSLFTIALLCMLMTVSAVTKDEQAMYDLVGRATDAPEVIEQRLNKAEYELSFADKFDRIVINDDLEKAKVDVYNVIKQFLDK